MWKYVRFLVSFYDGATKTFVSYLKPLPVVVANPTANPETGLAKEATLLALLALTPTGQSELTARMKAFHPQAGWRIWLDTSNASHIYVLEALASKVAGDTGFQGTRVPKDADGNPLGKVQVNTSVTLTFSNRTTDPGWA